MKGSVQMKSSVQRWMVAAVVLGVASLALSGCPEPPKEAYNRGFDEGFGDDGEYWKGYFDGYEMMGTAILYDGHDIPHYDEYSHDAGYHDGLWWAYNDGYFVDYHDAFIIGWSEGYDRGYREDYLEFLGQDEHIEYLHGGWVDGYHDGFSEGRVFGAADYEEGGAFDWLAALFEYEDGLDLQFEGLDLGTGRYGPVLLYEWGQNPHALVDEEYKAAAFEEARERIERADREVPAIRADEEHKAAVKPDDMYRPLVDEVQTQLDVEPETLKRTGEPVEHLDTTWLERVTQYREAVQNGE